MASMNHGQVQEIMQSPMRKNSQLPPISPNLNMTQQSNQSGKRDLSKPKTYQIMQQ